MSNVFILDGETKSALAAVRALGTAGHQVVVGAETKSAMALYSKYATATFVYPSPKTNQEDFIDCIEKEVTQYTGESLLALFSDATYLTVARHRELFSKYFQLRLPTPTAVETAFSKEHTYLLAEEMGIPVIQEFAYDNVSSYPVVVKPRHSVSWETGQGVFGSAEFAFSADEYKALYEQIKQVTGEEPIVQECIFGGEYGFEVMCQDGEIVQSFVHKRIRSLSPRGGASTVKETCSDEQLVSEMTQHSTALVKRLSWTGPMMVEFKYDEKQQALKLMEINGRFWGSLPLAVAAGVDFPNGYVAVARGEALPEAALHLAANVRTQHFLGDVQWLLRVFFAQDRLRSKLYPNRLRALLAFLYDSFFTTGDVFSWSDPAPTIAEFINVLEKKLWR